MNSAELKILRIFVRQSSTPFHIGASDLLFVTPNSSRFNGLLRGISVVYWTNCPFFWQPKEMAAFFLIFVQQKLPLKLCAVVLQLVACIKKVPPAPTCQKIINALEAGARRLRW
jgi:hypothetical protein